MARSRENQAESEGGDGEGKAPIAINWPAPESLDGASLSDLVRVGLASLYDNDKRGRITWGQLLVERLFQKAAEGDLRALQEIWTRLEGKPGTQNPAALAPLDIDDDLARMILEYDGKKADSSRDEVGGR